MATRKLTTNGCAMLLGLAAGLQMHTNVAMAAKPIVEIRVDFKAELLAGLPQRDFVKREVVNSIRDKFQDRFRLFSWSPGQGAKVATLVVRVTQTPLPPLPAIDVDWVLEVPGQPDHVLHIEPQRVYGPNNMQRAFGEPDTFKKDLGDALREVMKEGFFDHFREKVLKRIPIARDAVPIPEDRMISVPLMWNESQLSHEAVLRVWFERKEGDATKRGSFDINILNERTAAPGKGMIQGGVTAATWDTGELPVVSRWNTQLPSLLQGAQISCHVETYKENIGGGGVGMIQLTR